MARVALILHDDEPTLALVRGVVEAAGYECVVTTSTYKAMAAADPATVQLVVMGMTTVDDRDIEVVALLRRRLPTAHLLVLFPVALRERAAQALAQGADGLLPEPFYPAEMASIARRVAVRATAPAPPPTAESATRHEPSRELNGVHQLASGVAHSIRNPLQILELQIGSVESDGTVDAPAMREQFRRIATVVEGLTRFSGHRNLALRPVDVHALLNRVFGARRKSGGPEIVSRLATDRMEVLGAPELLRAAFETLRTRAERVTPAGGKIEVRTNLRADEGRRWVEVAVQDGGPSLAEDRRARLFEPYPEPDSVQDGTGLELAGLAGVARDHGGSTSALAGANGGTTIVLRLPARPEVDASTTHLKGAEAR